MGDVGVKQVDSKTEVLCNRFQSAINDSSDISHRLYEKVNKLSAFSLDCEIEKPCVQDERPEGLITGLDEMLDKLVYLNRKNSEILSQLNSLV